MKCKLLVAEDELIERKVLCKTLQKYLGDLIVLYEARNGREALELFAQEAPQVVILDIEMPGYTGLEVARKIRETDKNCGILFLTGYDKFAYAKQAIAVRALDYLLKPYKEQELVFAVEDAIRQVSARSTPLPPRVQPTAPAAPLHTEEEDEDVRTSIIRAEMLSFIEAHYREDISMQDAATALRYSDAYFCKRFKQCFKVNFSAYLNEYRVGKARQLVLDPLGIPARKFKQLKCGKEPEVRLIWTCFRFFFASFFLLGDEKIVLGYKNDKIVLRFTKNSRFAAKNPLLQ